MTSLGLHRFLAKDATLKFLGESLTSGFVPLQLQTGEKEKQRQLYHHPRVIFAPDSLPEDSDEKENFTHETSEDHHENKNDRETRREDSEEKQVTK